MTRPTATILDFDETITIRHTARNKSLYTPANNTKTGLEKVALHDDDHIVAIATFHYDPDYVLSYLLPLLQLDLADMHKEVVPLTHHTIYKYHFQGKKYPILISIAEYKNGEPILKDKNIPLRDITGNLPLCSEYSFYDDSPQNLKKVTDAEDLSYFSTYLVPNWIKEIFSPLAPRKAKLSYDVILLIKNLENYKIQRGASPHEYRGWGSFFSFNFLGYSKHAKIRAVDGLINYLKTGEQIDIGHQGPLSDGNLAIILDDFSKSYGRNWYDLRPQIDQQPAFILRE